MEAAVAVELDCVCFRVDSCRHTDGAADGGEQNLLGIVGAVSDLQQRIWCGSQRTVFAVIVGGDVLKNPSPQLMRVGSKLLLLLGGEGIEQSLAESGQCFMFNARGEQIWDVDFLRQVALSRCQQHVLLEDVRFQVGFILNSQLMEQLCTQLHLFRIGNILQEGVYLIGVALCIKERFGCIFGADSVQSQRLCCLCRRLLGVEGAFLLVQQGSGVVKPLLLGCLLLIGQANGKFHVVLWWNDIVFGSVQLGGLAGRSVGEVDLHRWFLAGVDQAGDKASVLERMDVQVAQAQCNGSLSVFIGDQGRDWEEFGVVEQLDA